MKPIPSDAASPFPAECPGDVEPGWDAWMPERPDMEWTIAELAAWAAILSVRAGKRGSASKEGLR